MSEIEIEVRSLTGESINVSISSNNNSIHQLKLLLKQTFPPATSSPNFHLFLKGTKLSLQSKITSISISDGDFIVLVPFTGKEKQQAMETSVKEKDFGKNDECSTSKFADSAWSDMMQDLTSLQERQTDGDENQPDVEFGRTELNVQKEGDKGLFDEGINELLNVLEKCDGDELGGERCGKFLQVLELVNCLSDSKTWECMLRKANIRSSGIGFGVERSCLCICPSWLKVLLKGFYFVNIYSTFLQVWQEKVTLLSLEGGLNQPEKFGFGFKCADLESLSLLCPKRMTIYDGHKIN